MDHGQEIVGQHRPDSGASRHPLVGEIQELTGEVLFFTSLWSGTCDSRGIYFHSPEHRIVRKAVSWATITGTITQTKDEKGRTIIRTEQTATGGLKAETETIQLDGSEQVHESAVFGSQRARSRWLDLTSEHPAPGVSSKEEIDPYLGEGWLEEEPEGSPGHVWITATNERAGWRVDQVWGFALVDGQRYHVKKFVATKGEGRVTARMVYAWVPAR